MRPGSLPRFAVSAIGFAIVLVLGVEDGGRPVAAAAKTTAQVAKECAESHMRLEGNGSEAGLKKQILDISALYDNLYTAQDGDRERLSDQEVIELQSLGGPAHDPNRLPSYSDNLRAEITLLKKRVAVRAMFLSSLRSTLSSMKKERDLLVDRERENGCSGAGTVADPFRNLTGNWELEWKWTVTSVRFRGPLRGSGWSLNFEGILEGGGGNQIWQPPAGSGSATCLLTTPPGAKPHLHCDAELKAGHQDQNGMWIADAWHGDADGTVSSQVPYRETKARLIFKGYGNGLGGDGKPAEIDALNLTPVH